MKITFAQRAATAVACIGLLLPQAALAADAVKINRTDIALGHNGMLVGQVVDAHGKPIAESSVSVMHGKSEIVRTVTDKQGRFAAQGLRGGEHQVVTAGGQVNYRLWAPQTAPPAANTSALVVAGADVVNGQCNTCGPAYGQCDTCEPASGGIVGFVKSHPLLVAGGVAAAIAIPLALADDDDPSS